jgi:hypothetical protein
MLGMKELDEDKREKQVLEMSGSRVAGFRERG